MREFDDFEKRIIRKLKGFKERGVNLNFLSILADFFTDRGIEVNKKTDEAWICFDTRKLCTYDQSINAWIPKVDLVYETAPTTEVIIKVIFLLNYLDKNGIVFLFDFARSDKDVVSFPEFNTKPVPTKLIVSDKKVVELLISYFHKEIVISQSIITLVNNNFLTTEEIQHAENVGYANRSLKAAEKSIKSANRAIKYSIILGVVGLVISIYSIVLTQRQIEQPIEIKKEQLENLKSTLKPIDETKVLEKISNQIDSLNNGLKVIHKTTEQISDRIKNKK